MLHHIETHVPVLADHLEFWDWLLCKLGWSRYMDWGSGRSWQWKKGVYLVLAAGDFNVQNHLAFSVNSQAIVDGIWHEVEVKGGKRLYEDEYPYADGHGHYAAYFLDPGGIKFEIVWVSDSPR